ncbi:MAG: cytochrome c biogenesis protein CcdA [Candidatus Micrarchaeota archaeon]|nr:cytochrome c biogenesis protein CcdA [Candidatus Micrarchaeota archaeon]
MLALDGEAGLAAAFLAGILSFFSPCVFPLLPAFFAYLSGGMEKIGKRQAGVLKHILFFVAGFSLSFAAFGAVMGSLFGGVGGELAAWLPRLGGIVIILFALHLMGILKIPFLLAGRSSGLMRGAQARLRGSFAFSFLVGASLAVSWTPCAGPVLGSIFLMAVANPQGSFWYFLFYSIGLSLPFIAAGAFVSRTEWLVRKAQPYLHYFNYAAGMLMFLVGLMAISGTL